MDYFCRKNLVDVDDDGTVQYHKSYRNHRENGPSAITNDGVLYFEVVGSSKRLDGPCCYYSHQGAVEYNVGQGYISAEEFLYEAVRTI